MSAEQAWDESRLRHEFPDLDEVELLGRGGFASVYRVQHPRLGVVALKVLTGGVGWELDEQSRREFWEQVRSETEAIGSLSAAPNIVTLHTSGLSTSGWPYLIMELCPGGSVSDVIRRHRRPDEGAVPGAVVMEVGVSVARALAVAHAQGILHLDVKPANILRSRFGVYQLSDFGISRQISDGGSSGEEVYLTPHYAAPELWEPQPLVGPACDVYALGVSLYQMAALQRPYEGSAPAELAVRIRSEAPPPLRRADLPPQLTTLIAECLGRDPEHRPSSAQVAQRLDDLSARIDATRTIKGLPRPPERELPEDQDATRVRRDLAAPPDPVPIPVPDEVPDAGSGEQPTADGSPGPVAGTGKGGPSQVRSRTRGVLAAAFVAVIVGIALIGIVDRCSQEPGTLSDEVVLVGAEDQAIAPPGSTLPPRATALAGQPSSVTVVGRDDGDVELSWTVETPRPDVDYATLSATFPVDPATGQPALEPSSSGLLGVDGGVADDEVAVRRWDAATRSARVSPAPDVVTCFRVVAITEAKVIPSAQSACAPARAPAAPKNLAVALTSDGRGATVSWTDSSSDESRFRIIQVAERGGVQVVIAADSVPAGVSTATVAVEPDACIVVRAENASNQSPQDLTSSGPPDDAGRSEPWCPS
jgi:serine/threonine protein kinase